MLNSHRALLKELEGARPVQRTQGPCARMESRAPRSNRAKTAQSSRMCKQRVRYINGEAKLRADTVEFN